MKYDHLPIVFIVNLIIIEALFENVNGASYQSQEVDPLQPVWDSIDQLSNVILEDMQQILNKHATDMNTDFDNKIQDFKSHMSTIATTQSAGFKDEYDKTKETITEFLSVSFHDMYQTRIMIDENEALLTYSNNNINTSLSELEVKLFRHIDQTLGKADFLFEFNDTLWERIAVIKEEAESMSDTITKLDRNVTNIREVMTTDTDDVCVSVGNDFEQYVRDGQLSPERIQEFESEWDATYQAVVGDTSAVFFQRDCSDILSSNPNATSGVYSIHPSREIKRKLSVWCDMEAGGNDTTVGGWTVVLRRRNTSFDQLDFNRSWDEYKDGFGEASNEGEWWLGLKWIHELTYNQPYQVLFLIHDIEEGDFKAHYSTFKVEDETRNFRLIVDGFTGTVRDAFKDKHHGQQFSTPERDNDKCDTCNCALNNQGGWWFNACHWTSLTSPFPTSKDRSATTIRWQNGEWLVLDDVTMMIRPTNYQKPSNN